MSESVLVTNVYGVCCRRVWEKVKKKLIGRDQLMRVDKQSIDRAVGNRPHQVRMSLQLYMCNGCY